jgi:hypothetical protein
MLDDRIEVLFFWDNRKEPVNTNEDLPLKS